MIFRPVRNRPGSVNSYLVNVSLIFVFLIFEVADAVREQIDKTPDRNRLDRLSEGKLKTMTESTGSWSLLR